MIATTGRLRIAQSLLAAVILTSAPHTAIAQFNYPSRTVKIVVPAPPGPLIDVLPRIIGQKLSAKLGQAIIVENRPGAAQNLGAEIVARAEPDGYTLLVTPPGPLVISRYFYPNLGFDPSAFAPITVLVTFPFVVLVNPRIPASTFPELIAYAKANPDKLTYGSPGTGSTPQLAIERLARTAGIHLIHVPYQGLAPAMHDLLAGHIDMTIDLVGNALPYIRQGQLKPLAVTGKDRVPELPDVPAVSELLSGFVHAEWFAVVAPPGTSPEITAKLSQAIGQTLRLPDVSERLHEFYVTPIGSSPEETTAFIKGESERWRDLIAAMGIKAQ